MTVGDISGQIPTPLVLLSQAIARIVVATTIDDVIEAVRKTARQLVGSDGITVVRRDGEFCHYVEEDAIGRLWKGQKFPITACITGWAMLNRATVVVPDIARDDRIPHELYAETFVKAVSVAPVRTHAPIGAIGAYWARPYTPSDDEIAMLEALANASASAMERAMLAAELDALHERR
jgi:GAF domain-containing protein